MKFGFVAKHRGIWPVRWLCEALDVSRSGFHAWLSRSPSARALGDEVLGAQVKASFIGSDRTYGALRWSRLVGQFAGRVKLGSGCRQAASLSTPSIPYASSGVCPPRAEWGRRVL